MNILYRRIVTRAFVAAAQRTIRTFKAMTHKRIETTKNKDHANQSWTDVLHPVMLTYNHKDKHSTSTIPSADAMKPDKQLQVKQINRERHWVQKQTCTEIHD